jgi:putative aldouronate transport system substrate-binding protein
VGADGAVLSSASKNIEVAFRWLDTIYEEKTNLELSWGPIEWMSDTTFRMMKIPPGEQAAAFRNNGITPKNIWPVDYIAQKFSVVDPPLGVAERTAYGKIIAPYAPEENFPTRLAISTLEEGEILQQYGTDITEYVQRRIAEFIYKGGAEGEWDEYVATVEKMGLARITEVHQNIYDRFKTGVGGDTSLK